ncbi:MAG: DUF357 domain-containing protein [Candidatus Bathyarchaeia archaeon]
MKPKPQKLEEKYNRYEANLRKAFAQISSATATLSEEPREVIDLAFRYVEDGKYFKEKGDLTTALISLSYAEGLLDTLRILNIVSFTWVEKQVNERE